MPVLTDQAERIDTLGQVLPSEQRRSKEQGMGRGGGIERCRRIDGYRVQMLNLL